MRSVLTRILRPRRHILSIRAFRHPGGSRVRWPIEILCNARNYRRKKSFRMAPRSSKIGQGPIQKISKL